MYPNHKSEICRCFYSSTLVGGLIGTATPEKDGLQLAANTPLYSRASRIGTGTYKIIGPVNFLISISHPSSHCLANVNCFLGPSSNFPSYISILNSRESSNEISLYKKDTDVYIKINAGGATTLGIIPLTNLFLDANITNISLEKVEIDVSDLEKVW